MICLCVRVLALYGPSNSMRWGKRQKEEGVSLWRGARGDHSSSAVIFFHLPYQPNGNRIENNLFGQATKQTNKQTKICVGFGLLKGKISPSRSVLHQTNHSVTIRCCCPLWSPLGKHPSPTDKEGLRNFNLRDFKNSRTAESLALLLSLFDSPIEYISL